MTPVNTWALQSCDQVHGQKLLSYGTAVGAYKLWTAYIVDDFFASSHLLQFAWVSPKDSLV